MSNPADEIEALKAALAAAHAQVSAARATIAHLELVIAQLRRDLYGQRSERKARLLAQLEQTLEDVQATATEDELAAEQAAAAVAQAVPERKRPARKPFPEHLPRERVVVPGPDVCPCCGSDRLVKLGETVTETLEAVPRQWKVIQTVREKLSCRACETITQPPAPFHVIPRAWAGPSLLAMILFEKFGQHQPLNRQRDRYEREGVPLSLSTLADQVGACAVALRPIYDLIRAHVLAAERIHADDTPVPVLAKGKTATARLWTYVRDDAPFGGSEAPAALFHYSRDRSGDHPESHLAGYAGILQADAYAGFNGLYAAGRAEGPLTVGLCWAHSRRRFFVLADLASKARRRRKSAVVSPLAAEAVKRIDAIFDAERGINRCPEDRRLAVRREVVAPLVRDLEAWMRTERKKLSAHAEVAQAMDYMLKRWPAFTSFLHDGRICLSNNAAERALRGIALGRKAWLFCGSDRGGQRAAIMYTLIGTAKLNDIDPQAWLTDVLARIADIKLQHLHQLLPWNWKPDKPVRGTVAA